MFLLVHTYDINVIPQILMPVCYLQYTGMTVGSGNAADCDFVLMSCQRMAMLISSLQPVKLEHISFFFFTTHIHKGNLSCPCFSLISEQCGRKLGDTAYSFTWSGGFNIFCYSFLNSPKLAPDLFFYFFNELHHLGSSVVWEPPGKLLCASRNLQLTTGWSMGEVKDQIKVEDTARRKTNNHEIALHSGVSQARIT